MGEAKLRGTKEQRTEQAKNRPLTLKDLAVNHDYYSHEANYYSRDAALTFQTWQDFYKEFGDADVDRNLVYRWDIYWMEETQRYYMRVFIICQRKGRYMPVCINLVQESDVPQIVDYLKPHWAKLNQIWTPLS